MRNPAPYNVISAKVSDDKKSVELVFDKLVPGHVHELKCEGLRSATGKKLLNNTGWYTLNNIPGQKYSYTPKGKKQESAKPDKKQGALKLKSPTQTSKWEKGKKRLAVMKEADKQSVDQSLPTQLTAKPKKKRRALVFYRCEGFVHSSISFGNYTLQKMGELTGAFSVDLSDEYQDLSADNLAKYDLVVFNSTTRLKMPEAQKKALLDFVKGGKGFVGIHAASDNFADWQEGSEMIGGLFSGHPWLKNGGEWVFKNDAPENVLNEAFHGQGFSCSDEIYCYKKPVDREKMSVLLSLDMSEEINQKPLASEKNKKKFPGVKVEDVDNPVSWYRSYGKGRMFYTNFGHNESTYSNAAIMKHLFDGLQYAAGDLVVD